METEARGSRIVASGSGIRSEVGTDLGSDPGTELGSDPQSLGRKVNSESGPLSFLTPPVWEELRRVLVRRQGVKAGSRWRVVAN